ncbi:hypothetical protein CBER1_04601 [Cercospora berteroae]|uniref:Uncharacterized protein n=1 Tax=Cercospora berteroae TaxID=357750 RepID=A0A2S6C2D1_9PEZI|nr:hypothetical protein CBER1_04601 [Cercospora berteroae]
MAGLGEATSPPRAWSFLRDGEIVLPEEAIQESLRNLAVTIIRHKQLIASHHGVAFDEGDPLLHFVSVTHGRAPTAGRLLRLEDLNTQQVLSFPHWEGVWCATIADVRSMHDETLEAPSSKLMHNHGSTSDESDAPFTVAHMQALLRDIWAQITDPRFVGPLEVAVRIHEHAQTFRKSDLDYTFQQTFVEVWERYSIQEKTDILNNTLGMLDVAHMRPDEIHEDLRVHCFPKIIQASHEELGIPYTGPHEQQQEPEPALPSAVENTCCCPPNCACRIVCQYGIHECECKTRRNKTRSAPAPTPEASSSPAPPPPPASGSSRPRGNTTGSHRFHHPQGAHQQPRRQPLKDVYPTDFYLSRGSGRYPAFSSSPPESQAATFASSSSPFHPPAQRTTPAPPEPQPVTFATSSSPFHPPAPTEHQPAIFATPSSPFYPPSARTTPAPSAHFPPPASTTPAPFTPPSRTTPAPLSLLPSTARTKPAPLSLFPSTARTTPAPPAHSPPRTPEETSAPSRPSFTNRRLVSAGGNLPLSARPSIPETYLPAAPAERGFSISKEEYAALPTPRRAQDPTPAYTLGESEAAPSRKRRPSWMKRVFGSKKGSSE